ncbi:MAG: thymidine kinase [Phycisphaerae bacterium]|jgi:thymidine kinase
MNDVARGTRNQCCEEDPHAPPRNGRITFLTGCMFSGKTTEMLRRLEAFDTDAVRTFKHTIDRRYRAEAVVTHGGLMRPAVRVDSADAIFPHVEGTTKVVAIDEAHFFDDRLVDLTREFAERGMGVILTALNLSSWGQPFAVTERLHEIADESLVLTAACANCGASALHTQRITPLVGTDIVGGAESYEPRCTRCWHPPPEPPPSGM